MAQAGKEAHRAGGIVRFDRFVPRMEHMAERFALLTLIALGEGFFKLVVTLSEKAIYKVQPDMLLNFFSAVFRFSCCAGCISILLATRNQKTGAR